MKHTACAASIAAIVSTIVMFTAQVSPAQAATAGSANSQKWATFQMNPSAQLTGVAFATALVGWLVGGNEILRTQDGGLHFKPQYHGPLSLQNVVVTNARQVVAYGPKGAVMTRDGGRKWFVLRVPDGGKGGGQISGLQFPTPDIGFASVRLSDGTQTLYRTTDGGSKWQGVPLPHGAIAQGFTNATAGWAIVTAASYSSGGKGAGGFFRTLDAGEHWTKTQGEPVNAWFSEGATIYPLGANVAYAQVVGGAGMSQSSSTIFLTTNGINWKPILATSTGGGGPAPGVGQQNVATGPGYDAGPVATFSPNDLWVVGGMEATGLGAVGIARSTDRGVKWLTLSPIPGANGMPAGESALSFVNPRDGWLLDGFGAAQSLLRTTDGGAKWRQVYPHPQTWPVMEMNFTSNTNGYGLGVVGDINRVVRTKDGGRTWTLLSRLPVRNSLSYVGPQFGQGISFADTSVGLAVGGDGRLYGTTDGGIIWHFVATPAATGSVISVQMVTNLDSAIKTNNGIYFSTNGGRTWKSYPSKNPESGDSGWLRVIDQLTAGRLQTGFSILGPNDMAVASFAGIRASIRWMQSGDGQDFLASTDGGKHWINYRFRGNAPIMVADLGFTSTRNGWMWTLQGQLFVTVDGGQKWAEVG